MVAVLLARMGVTLLMATPLSSEVVAEVAVVTEENLLDMVGGLSLAQERVEAEQAIAQVLLVDGLAVLGERGDFLVATEE